MSADALIVPRGEKGAHRSLLAAALAHWPLLLGFGIMAIATFIRLAEQVWPLEIGAHGPIVLATGAWLLFHIRGELAALASEPPKALALSGFVAAIACYAFGRPYDLLVVEAFGVYLFFLSAFVYWFGLRPIMNNVFPFLYLAFLIPIPGWILDRTTAPLQTLISYLSTGILSALGYPVDRQGIVIFIAQYRLLVEDACSGMNSLIGLIAVILFYIYIIHRASLRYTLALGAAIIPISIVVNLIRVLILILLTYYAGDAVAQGFLHVTTGIVLFAAGLGFTILLDKLIRGMMERRRRSGQSEVRHA